MVNSILAILANTFLVDELDHIIWAGDPNGKFSVKALCSLVEHKLLNKADWVVPVRVRKVVPLKVVLFVWQVLHNSVVVKSNLISRGMTLQDEGRCSLCGLCIETTSHIFLLCTHAWTMLCHVMWLEGIHWCCPLSVNDLFQESPELRKTIDLVLWDIIPFFHFLVSMVGPK